MVSRVDFGDSWRWYKAGQSSDSGGACVCVTRDGRSGEVGVRDSKLGAAGEPLWYSAAAFGTFLISVKRGEFDCPS
jgi:Domain of unknown function (DUF397)